MEQLLQDAKYGMRRLAHQPGFTMAAVVTLALGIGANAALFSLLNAVLLRPSPGLTDAEQLVTVYTSDYSGPAYGSSSHPDYEVFRGATDVFAGMAAYAMSGAALGNPDAPQRVGVEITTPNYFDVLGVPVRGRSYSDEEAKTSAAVAVVSDAFWRAQLEGSESAIGRTILLNARPVTVVGIAAPGFRGSQRGIGMDVWVPLYSAASLGMGYGELGNRGDRGLNIVARLNGGVDIDAAQQRMNLVAQQMYAEFGDAFGDLSGSGRRITLQSERSSRVPPMMRTQFFGFAGLLAAMSGLVLLICCANVAGLMIARVAARNREIAVRLSLGATRGRIRRLLLSESALVSVAGALLGLLGAVWSIDALLGLIPSTLPVAVVIDASLDARVLGFTAFVTIIAALIFGAAPAMHAGRTDLTSVLKSGDMLNWGGRRFTLRSMLVAGQVAASVLLLVMASLFLRSLRVAAGVDLGYAVTNVLLVDLGTKPGRDVNGEARARVALAVTERINGMAGVASATWAKSAPLGMEANSRRGATVDGYTPAQGEDMEFHFNIVGPEYFETLALPLVRGRDFTAQDAEGSERVVVVNETFARRFWPGQDPLGKRLSFSGPQGDYFTVVGMAKDAAFVNVSGETVPYTYTPALQQPTGTLLHVRTNADPMLLSDAVKAAVAEVAPDWTTHNPRTMERQVAGSVLPQRIAGHVLTGFGLLALLLAGVGLYGVVAYSVAQRTREMGIRLALGATRGGILQMAVGSGMKLVLIGLLVGTVLALGLARVVAFLLLGMSPMDPITFFTVPTVLMAVTLLATYLPARRAARVDPMTALRAE